MERQADRYTNRKQKIDRNRTHSNVIHNVWNVSRVNNSTNNYVKALTVELECIVKNNLITPLKELQT